MKIKKDSAAKFRKAAPRGEASPEEKRRREGGNSIFNSEKKHAVVSTHLFLVSPGRTHSK